jgi:PAS domain S-box-containing protein
MVDALDDSRLGRIAAEADPEVDAEAAATYRRVVEQTEHLLVRMSIDYTVLFISPGVKEALGFDPEDCVGVCARRAVRGDLEPWAPTHQELLKGGKITLAAPFNHRDGSVRWLSTTITGVPRYPGGPVVELVALARDVTQMHEAEVELETSRAELERLARRLEHVREDERTGLARELHDGLLQPLAGLKLELDWLAERSETPVLRSRLKQLGKSVAPLVERTRRISFELRPAVLDELGLAAAIEAEVEALLRRTGSALRVSLMLDEIPREPRRDRALLRIFREALSNVEHHANADGVEVRLEQAGDRVRLEVRDDGDGFDVDAHDRAGVGLVAMRERALAAGGRLVLHRGSAGGTVVGADFPAC